MFIYAPIYERPPLKSLSYNTYVDFWYMVCVSGAYLQCATITADIISICFDGDRIGTLKSIVFEIK